MYNLFNPFIHFMREMIVAIGRNTFFDQVGFKID